MSLAASQDPAETSQSEGRCPRDQAYYASLWSVGHVRLREVKKKDKVFSFYHLEAPGYPRGVFLPLPRGLGQAFLNQRIGVVYAPRTDEQGALKGRLDYLRRLDPALWERAPYLHLPDGRRGYFAGWTGGGAKAFVEVDGVAHLVDRELVLAARVVG